MTRSSTPDAWPSGALAEFGAAGEIEISTRRRDGSLRPFVPIWIVTIGDALYVRSYRGAGGAWYRHVIQDAAGAIRAAGQQADVTFTPVGQQHGHMQVVDDAYRSKYARYGTPICSRCSPTRPSSPPCSSPLRADLITSTTRKRKEPS